MKKKTKIVIAVISACAAAIILGVGIGVPVSQQNSSREGGGNSLVVINPINNGETPVSSGQLVLPNGTTEVTANAYQNKGIVTLSLPMTTTKVGAAAFTDNDGLITVKLPKLLYDALSGSGNYQAKKIALDAIFGSQVRTYESIDSSETYTAHNPSTIDNGQTNVNNGQLTLSDVVTEVAANAYQNKGITTLTVPLLVTSVGAGAFTGNTGLVTVALSKTLYDTLSGNGNYQAKKIALDAIFGSQVTTYQSIDGTAQYAEHKVPVIDNGQTSVNNGQLVLPNGTTEVTANAYQNKGITSITFPSLVTSVGAGAFTGNTGLVTVALSKTLYDTLSGNGNYQVKKIALDAIFGPQVTTYQSIDSGTTYTDHNPSAIDNGQTNVNRGQLPLLDIVTEVAANAYQNKGITLLTLPALVTKVGSAAFTDNAGLVTVRLSKTLYDVLSGSGNYQDRKAALDAIFGPQVTTYQSIDGMTTYTDHNPSAIDNGQTKVIDGKLAILDIVTQVTANAYQNKGITSLTINPPGNFSAEAGAFTGNSGLLTVNIPRIFYDVIIRTGFGYQAKKDILDAIFGPQVTAYQSIDGMTTYTDHLPSTIDAGQSPISSKGELTLLDTVTEVTASSLYQGRGIVMITLPASVKKVGESAFTRNPRLTTIRLTQELYNTLSGTGDYQAKKTALDAIFGSQVTTYQSIDGIMTYIAHKAPATDDGKLSIIANESRRLLPDGITEVTADAYKGLNKGITSISLPPSLKKVGAGAFLGNESLGLVFLSIELYNTLSGIGTSEERMENLGKFFGSARPIQYVVRDDGAGEIINGALIVADGVDRVVISAYSDRGITSLTLPDTLTTILNFAFTQNQISNLKLPNLMVFIGEDTFSNNKLTSLVIPDSVTAIGERAFRNNELTSVTIGSSVRQIASSAFDNNKLTSITILASEINFSPGGVFKNNNDLTTVRLPKKLYDELSNEEGFSSNKEALDAVFGPQVTTYQSPDGMTTYTDHILSPVDAGQSRVNFYSQGLILSPIVTEVTPDAYKAVLRTAGFLTLTLPESILKVGLGAFIENPTLVTVKLSKMLYDTISGTGDYQAKKAALDAVFGSQVTTYESIDGTTTYTDHERLLIDNGQISIINNNLVLPDGIMEVTSNAYQNRGITSLTLPSSVTKVGVGAFTSNLGLLTVKLDRATYLALAGQQGKENLEAIFGLQVTTYESLDGTQKFEDHL